MLVDFFGFSKIERNTGDALSATNRVLRLREKRLPRRRNDTVVAVGGGADDRIDENCDVPCLRRQLRFIGRYETRDGPGG